MTSGIRLTLCVCVCARHIVSCRVVTILAKVWTRTSLHAVRGLVHLIEVAARLGRTMTGEHPGACDVADPPAFAVGSAAVSAGGALVGMVSLGGSGDGGGKDESGSEELHFSKSWADDIGLARGYIKMREESVAGVLLGKLSNR